MKCGSGRIRCDFCGKSKEVVKCMVQGPGVHICNECVAKCAEIVEQKECDDDFTAWKREVPERIMAFEVDR